MLVDLHGATRLDDLCFLETALRAAADQAGACLIDSKFHRFDSTGGVTGFVMLSESHISIHTWPELGFAALDIYMCGQANPDIACAYLSEKLEAKRVKVHRIKRGDISGTSDSNPGCNS